jgi:hypothetical protein
VQAFRSGGSWERSSTRRSGPTFAAPSGEGRQRAAAWSKWFGRHLRLTVGIAKVFHSLRHTFKRMCRDAGLPEEMHDALTGHAGPNGGSVDG